MKVEYTFTKIYPKGMIYGVSDLMKYYVDISHNFRKELDKYSKERGKTKMLMEKFLREKTGMTGITIDSIRNAIESLKSSDMFSFKVNDRILYDFAKKDTVTIEVDMNENYFLGSLALSQFIPQFRFTREKYPRTLQGEKLKWMDWFEGQWNKKMRFKGYENPHFIKEILEE